jgi:hypothetical protein
VPGFAVTTAKLFIYRLLSLSDGILLDAACGSALPSRIVAFRCVAPETARVFSAPGAPFTVFFSRFAGDMTL